MCTVQHTEILEDEQKHWSLSQVDEASHQQCI